MPPFADATVWNQYGLPGLIIGFLLVSFTFFARWFLNRTREADQAQQAFLDRVLAQHREERLEWREDAERKAEQHSESLRELQERTLAACDRNTDACQALIEEIHKLAARTT
jgi:hypothetical protein